MLVYSRVPETPAANGAPVAAQTPDQAKTKTEPRQGKAKQRLETELTLPDHIQTMVDAMNSTVNDQVQLNEQAKVGAEWAAAASAG